MRGARIAPHAARNPGLRTRQARQANFLRSSAQLTSSVRQEMKALSASQLRDMMPKSQPAAPLEPGPRQRAAEAIFSMLESIAEKGAPRLNEELKNFLSPNSASSDQFGRIAHGLGLLRDADGNVIFLDEKDHPFVLVDGKPVYVKVYKARVAPSGINNIDAKCTIQNPDGKKEVLLVEPVPVLKMPD